MVGTNVVSYETKWENVSFPHIIQTELIIPQLYAEDLGFA
jgi:hypothetical protein